MISLVVPVFNEAQALPAFMAALESRIHVPDARLELIFVNDGSRDGTLSFLLQLAAARDDVTLVNFLAQFRQGSGDDRGAGSCARRRGGADGCRFAGSAGTGCRVREKWREGYDIAYGLRQSRASDTRAKRVTAGAFYAWFNRISDTPIPVNVGDFRLLDRRVVHALRQLPERGRFMKGLFAWVGFHPLPYHLSAPRAAHGQSTWNYWKLWNFALEGIVSFSTAPLKI
ncbi:MAG: glycosyltransferase family 2 protein [Rhodospirillales bacterium]